MNMETENKPRVDRSRTLPALPFPEPAGSRARASRFLSKLSMPARRSAYRRAGFIERQGSSVFSQTLSGPMINRGVAVPRGIGPVFLLADGVIL